MVYHSFSTIGNKWPLRLQKNQPYFSEVIWRGLFANTQWLLILKNRFIVTRKLREWQSHKHEKCFRFWQLKNKSDPSQEKYGPPRRITITKSTQTKWMPETVGTFVVQLIKLSNVNDELGNVNYWYMSPTYCISGRKTPRRFNIDCVEGIQTIYYTS